MKLAVAIFCFNRVQKLETLLCSVSSELRKSELDFWIFHDGTNADNNTRHLQVQNLLNKYKFENPEVNIITRGSNYGLRKNILCGVNEVFNSCDAVIVLEDDLELHENFFDFMKWGLQRYALDDQVFSVNGWLPYNLRSDEVFMQKTFNCWGWATWKHKWTYTNYTDSLIDKLPFEQIKFFCDNFESNSWSQIYLNYIGKKHTWAINTHLHLFLSDRYALYPKFSLVANHGEDGTGENSFRGNNAKASFYWHERIDENGFIDHHQSHRILAYRMYTNASRIKRLVFSLAFSKRTLMLLSSIVYSDFVINIRKKFALLSF